MVPSGIPQPGEDMSLRTREAPERDVAGLYSHTLEASRDHKPVMASLKDTLLERYVLSKDEVCTLLDARSELLTPQLHGQRSARLSLCGEEAAA